MFLASAFQRFAFQTQSVVASLCEAWRRSQSDAYKKRLQDSGRILKPIAGFKTSSRYEENFSCVGISHGRSRRKGADVNVISLG